MDLSIIVVAYNVKELMGKCLKHIRQSKDSYTKEVIYVDNGSTDGSVAMIKAEFPEVKIIESPTNLGFIGANNLAYKYATGKYILLLNSDAFLGEHTLTELIQFMEKTPDCGVVGCKAIGGHGKTLTSIRFFPTPWRLFLMKLGLSDKLTCFQQINPMDLDDTKIQECDWVTGCCLLIRKEIVDELGFLLRPELFMYNDDNDLCLRVKKKGWKVYYHPTEIIHLSGFNNDKVARVESDKWRVEKLRIESELIYMRKNYGLPTMWNLVFLNTLYDLLKCLKAPFKSNTSEILKDHLHHIGLTFSLLTQTGYGSYPIER
jgi:hypothetical protein